MRVGTLRKQGRYAASLGAAAALADEPPALPGGEPTPHAVLLAHGDRVLEARLAHRALPADRLGGLGGELVLFLVVRVEDPGVDTPTLRVVTPAGASVRWR